MKSHMLTHTGEKPFKCGHEGCTYASTQLSNLKTHSMTHTGIKSFECDYKDCVYACTTSNHLAVHKRTHTGEKPFKCDYKDCTYSCATAGVLKTHKRTHTGEKPYECDYMNCRYACTTSAALSIHNRTHTDERPYECDFPECGKACKQSSHLKSHKRIHSGDTPYKCRYTDCNRRFNQSSSRNAHEHRHNPESAARTKQKEEWTAKLFTDNDILYQREVHITYHGCGEKDTWARLDFEIIHTENHIIIVSVDEGQHYRNGVLCEVARMSKVVCSIRAAGDMRRMVWIRFNPDPVKLDGRTVRRTKAERGKQLLETIKNSGGILASTTNEVSIVYLYYDAYTTKDEVLRAEVTNDRDYADVWKPMIHSVVV